MSENTDMSELVTWLRAQLGEIEKEQEGKWMLYFRFDCPVCGSEAETVEGLPDERVVQLPCGHIMAESKFVGTYGEYSGDPTILADVEAKLDIVERCERFMNEPDDYPNDDLYPDDLVSPRAVLARRTLEDLARGMWLRDGYLHKWDI